MESSSLLTKVRSVFHLYYQKVKNWAFVTTPGSDPLVRSYLFLRRGIGIIGVVFPPVLVIGTVILNRGLEISDSMSSYYYSLMRDVFVGSLWAIGIFLICYQYDHLDDIVSTVAGVCAIGLSLFPTPPDMGATKPQEIIGKFHATFTTGFLLALAIMAFLFTRGNAEKDKVTDTDKERKRKQRNNGVYWGCGIAMLVFIGLAALILLVPYLSDNRWHHQYHPLLWIEFLATWAFGIAWFVKGETYSMLKAAIQRLPLSRHAKSDHPMASSPPAVEQPDRLPADSSQPVVNG